MRFHLCLAGYAVVAALLLTATAPGGLSLCVQQTGTASIGLGCTCLDCADQRAADRGESSLNCCQRCESGDVMHSPCCTCSKLPAVASAITVHHELRPRLAVAPALRPPAVFVAELLPAGHLRTTIAALDLPPPLARQTVLRL